jgi:hypothetical protein
MTELLVRATSPGTISKALTSLWAFMRVRKKFWVAPPIVVWVLFGAALVLSNYGT